MDAPTSFGAWLREQRRFAGYTQKELAYVVGYSTALIRKIEANERRPSRHIVERLLGALQVPEAARPAARQRALTAPLPVPRDNRPPARRFESLPWPITPLVGRDETVAVVRGHLERPGVRLLTLTGAPGIGKTRLALAAAGAAGFAAGSAFVALAPIQDPDLVAPTIASTLGLPAAPGTALPARLAAVLGGQRLLLILDNFEQVVAAAPLVPALLAVCPGLVVLVTSRESLQVQGEHQFPVAPLAAPDPARLPDPAHLGSYPAVALFVERARMVQPDFALTADNASAITALCARLEGIPLAIELAAARVKLLPPAAMLARLGPRLALLIGGSRDLPARHQTLRAAIDWSYGLLAPSERRLFACLGVFAGSATLAAIEAVAPSDPPADPLAGVESLLNKSLLQQETGRDGEPRYRLLETIREYTMERLAAQPDAWAVRARHAAYYLALAEAAAPELAGPDQVRGLDRLETDYSNLRIALEWYATTPSGVERGLRLAIVLGRFWQIRSYFAEGRRWLTTWTADPGAPPPLRAAALARAATLAIVQGDYGAARALLAESLPLYEALTDRDGEATVLNHLGIIAAEQGDLTQARALFERTLALRRTLGDPGVIAGTLNNLGVLACLQEDFAAARAFYAESLAVQRALGDRQRVAEGLANLARVEINQDALAAALPLLAECRAISEDLGDQRALAFVLNTLGNVAVDQADYPQAAGLFARSLALYRDHGDKVGQLHGLEGAAAVLAAGDTPEPAACLVCTVEHLRARLELPRPAVEQPAFARTQTRLRAALDPPAWVAAEGLAQALSLDQATALALDALAKPGAPGRP